MRIRGVQIPPGYLRWAAAGAGVVVLGILIAVLVSATGLFGTSQEDQGTTVRATVVAGVPCNHPGATETVKFTIRNQTHQARFDGCGHAKNEPVDVTIPSGIPSDALPKSLLVHAADAAMGDQEAGEGLGLLLVVVSGTAGATYAFLIRRGPRTTRLPPPLRLA